MKDSLRSFRIRTRPNLARALILAATYLLILGMLAAAATPQQYDLQVGRVAPITITATKDVEDTVATQRLIEQAMAAVSPSYVADPTALNQVISDLNGAFASLDAIRAEPDDVSVETLLASYSAQLGDIELEEAEIQALRAIEPADLTALESRLRRLVREELNSNVTEGQEKSAAERIRKDLAASSVDASLLTLMDKLVQAYIRPTMLLDVEVTEANRQKAADGVSPVIYKQGQNIVRSGEVITASQYEMLSSLGLLMDNVIDVALYSGLAIALLLLLGAVYAFLFVFESQVMGDLRNLLLTSAILALVSALCLVTGGVSPYLMPIPLAALLVGVLLKPRIGFIVSLSMSMICVMMTIASTEGTKAFLYLALSGVSSACLCNSVQLHRQGRLLTLLCGVIAALCGMASVLASMMISNANLANSYQALAFAAAAGILSGVLCIGLQPALEWAFNLMTQTKLLELSNPNHPLLRRLLLEAPGTYHHSIIVANLAEAGAAAIGANGLLARVGAYYHDVGKLKRPLYFKENQMGDNPHDRTDPAVSSAILTVHPRDGVAMAKKYRIPKPILDIIEQHHGDTPTLYFYAEAKKKNPNVNIDDFRYAGPRPQTAEAAVVMLADTVEAATRASGDSDPAKTEQLLRKLIRAKMDDGQLGESPLTLRDLEKICAAFHTVLTGVFHERIEYPVVDTQPRAVPAGLPEAEEAVKEEANAH